MESPIACGGESWWKYLSNGLGKSFIPRTVRERASNRIGKVAREAKYAYNRNYEDRAMEIGGELAVEEWKRK